MKLYIEIENNLPVSNPALEENLIQAFGEIPNNWEPFIRIERPNLTVYQFFVQNEPIFEKIDGVWQDVWLIGEISEEEKKAKQQAVIDAWPKKKFAHNFTAWSFNEELCIYTPPIPRPNDGNFYRWYGAENRWRIADPFPDDGKQYYFDFDNWINVEITDV